MSPRLHEYCRHVEAEVVSNSKNKIHQTWGPPFSRALYKLNHVNLRKELDENNDIYLVFVFDDHRESERKCSAKARKI